MTIEHTPHDEDFIDPACPLCRRDSEAMRTDPLTVSPEDADLGSYRRGWSAGLRAGQNSVIADADATYRRGLWIGSVFLALAAVLVTLALLAAGGHLR